MNVKQMSDEELRVRCARLAGWVYLGNGDWRKPNGTLTQAMYSTGVWDGCIVGVGKWDEDVPPDYPQDLNAMYDAETLITRGSLLETRWVGELELITFGALWPDKHEVVHLSALLKATAPQRCAAFVITMESGES